MRHMSSALSLVVFAGLCGWSDDGHAARVTRQQSAARRAEVGAASSPLTGHWRAAETEEEKERRRQTIEEATERMGRFRRGRARSRLGERTSPPASLTIEIEDAKAALIAGDRRLEVQLGGPPVEVEGSEGRAQLSALMEGDRLIVEARTDRGGRTTTYRADGDRLSMKVTLTEERLAAPVVYATTYIRAE